MNNGLLLLTVLQRVYHELCRYFLQQVEYFKYILLIDAYRCSQLVDILR